MGFGISLLFLFLCWGRNEQEQQRKLSAYDDVTGTCAEGRAMVGARAISAANNFPAADRLLAHLTIRIYWWLYTLFFLPQKLWAFFVYPRQEKKKIIERWCSGHSLGIVHGHHRDYSFHVSRLLLATRMTSSRVLIRILISAASMTRYIL